MTRIDYIKREDALDAIITCTDIFVNNLPPMIDKVDAQQEICGVPAADVVEVVQGCWAKQVVSSVVDGKRYPDYVEYRCSICGAGYVDIGYDYNFCPNCGADMRG